MINDNGFDITAQILDCACGIGTQCIGLASLGYQVSASDISAGEISEARERAKKNGVDIRFAHADFRTLTDRFSEEFDIVIAMDNGCEPIAEPRIQLKSARRLSHLGHLISLCQ